jgi:hypothetical protein
MTRIASVFLAALLLASAAFAAKPLATVSTNWDGIELDLMSVERKGSVLTVKWAVRNTGAEAVKPAFTMVGDGSSTYLVDEENGTKYYALTDKEGHILATMHEYIGSNRSGIAESIEPGTTKRYWAKFPAPPPAVKSISVFFTNTEPIEEVAITDK